MQNKRFFLMPIISGALLVVATTFWLMTAQPANAQCGSQASSCKDCHETQAQDPVNLDGTDWHQSHAFGDFCYMCHAGNSQSPDKTAAHTGLVSPMTDIKGSCASCHVKDYTEKAQVYATTLGVDLAGASPTAVPVAAPTSSSTSGLANNVAPALSQPVEASLPAKVVQQPVIDYIEQYDRSQEVKRQTNWGVGVLFGIVGVLVLAGLWIALTRLGWIKVSFAETKQLQGEYPVDVVDMLPELAQLKPSARKSLRRILAKPASAEFLGSLENLLGDEPEKK